MTVELTTDDAPPFDDVDTIVPVIRVELVVETYPNTQTATEEIADDLAQTRPAVGVAVGTAEAMQFAVVQERLDAISPAVPVEINAHLLVRRGDYRSVAHIRFPFSWSYRALIIATYQTINVANYIPTCHLHKVAPAGNTVIGACPYPCLPHPSSMRTSRPLCDITLPVTDTPSSSLPAIPAFGGPFNAECHYGLTEPCKMVHIVPANRLTNRLQTDSRAGRTLVIHTERKTVWIAARERGRAEARPLPCKLVVASQVVACPSRSLSKPIPIKSGLLFAFPSHRRSYPWCRIGGIGRLAANRLRSAPGRPP